MGKIDKIALSQDKQFLTIYFVKGSNITYNLKDLNMSLLDALNWLTKVENEQNRRKAA